MSQASPLSVSVSGSGVVALLWSTMFSDGVAVSGESASACTFSGGSVLVSGGASV